MSVLFIDVIIIVTTINVITIMVVVIGISHFGYIFVKRLLF